MTRLLCVLCLSATCFTHPLSAEISSAWQAKLKHELPLLGHRNWIVIADSAYPLQVALGIETVYADADQLQVVKTVLGELGKTAHVRPIVWTDSELGAVSEKDAPGIEEYRRGLHRILGEKHAQSAPHEKIITRLDEAGKTFRVLLIKTRLT